VLLAEFDRLRDLGLRDWRAPIVNDLLLMLAHGALRQVAARWLGPDAPALVTGLLTGCGVASVRPGAELIAIAARIRSRPAWAAIVTATPPDELVIRLAADASLGDLAARLDAYLDAWGDRAPRELQLERRTYREDPAALRAALRPLVASPGPAVGRSAGRPPAHARPPTDPRRHVRRRLLAHPAGRVRLAAFDLLLRATRRHVRWREEMRLARGQVFGVGRRIFRDLGIALRDGGVIDDPADVHFLTIGELRGLAAGTAVAGDPRELVRIRRARYAHYAMLPRLPRRLETRGPVTDPLSFVAIPVAPAGPGAPAGLGAPAGAAHSTPAPDDATTWRGTGASVGRVRAACLPVLEPAGAAPEPGRIIVARSTDPGWVPLLVGAAGLAVEQGGLLSHSAIVARELGIPAVVGLPGLLDRVHAGDVLELDGSTGIVRLAGDREAGT
jgi:pyruvate,water dikinase